MGIIEVTFYAAFTSIFIFVTHLMFFFNFYFNLITSMRLIVAFAVQTSPTVYLIVQD